jgi:hypothetical protein
MCRVQNNFCQFAEKVTTKSKYKEKRSKIQETALLLFPFGLCTSIVDWYVHPQSIVNYIE